MEFRVVRRRRLDDVYGRFTSLDDAIDWIFENRYEEEDFIVLDRNGTMVWYPPEDW